MRKNGDPKDLGRETSHPSSFILHDDDDDDDDQNHTNTNTRQTEWLASPWRLQDTGTTYGEGSYGGSYEGSYEGRKVRRTNDNKLRRVVQGETPEEEDMNMNNWNAQHLVIHKALAIGHWPIARTLLLGTLDDKGLIGG